MKKKIILLLAILTILPVFRINYYVEGVGMVEKRQSVVQILAEDLKNGTFGTGF